MENTPQRAKEKPRNHCGYEVSFCQVALFWIFLYPSQITTQYSGLCSDIYQCDKKQYKAANFSGNGYIPGIVLHVQSPIATKLVLSKKHEWFEHQLKSPCRNRLSLSIAGVYGCYSSFTHIAISCWMKLSRISIINLAGSFKKLTHTDNNI